MSDQEKSEAVADELGSSNPSSLTPATSGSQTRQTLPAYALLSSYCNIVTFLSVLAVMACCAVRVRQTGFMHPGNVDPKLGHCDHSSTCVHVPRHCCEFKTL
jgi:hypothetical protein